MTKYRILLGLLTGTALSYQLAAQHVSTDSTYQLPVATVSSPRLQVLHTGQSIQRLDSTQFLPYQGQPLADVLAAQTLIFVKNYGPSNIASTSTRGSNASQTALVWNGFNLESPTLGQVDWSIIPAGLFDELTVQYGGSGALWGSGAVGGAVHLNNNRKQLKGWQLSTYQRVGSFGYYQGLYKAGWGNSKVSVRTSWFQGQARNDFPFFYYGQRFRQDHAALERNGLMQDVLIRLSAKQTLSGSFWYGFVDRQLPPSASSSSAGELQQDEYYRASLQWQHQGKQFSHFLRTAYVSDRLWYESYSVSSRTNSAKSITEWESNWNARKNLLVNVGLNYTYNQANSRNYGTTRTQHRQALFVSARWNSLNNKVTGLASFRQERIDDRLVSPVASVGFEVAPSAWWKARGSVSRNFRAPTFNDLYYQPYGDPTLKPEMGWAEELGIDFLPKQAFSLSITAFNRLVTNYLQWAPTSSSWRPENKARVWARGLEATGKVGTSIQAWKLDGTLMYQYTKSTNENPMDETVGKQLFYIPYHQFTSTISIRRSNFQIAYNHHFTGLRYTSADNYSSLPAFQVGNVLVSQQVNFKTVSIRAYLNIYNLWNASYQVVDSRPMPPRNFQAGVSISWLEH